ncbi:MAG: type I-U CRISPR-associated protein Csb2 [Methanotrichaceae archaeon]
MNQDNSVGRHDDTKDNPTVAHFSLSGQALRFTDAILLTERIHAALVELSDGSSIFTGCDESGRPLKGHSHAYILSESNLALGRGRNGEITHVTVYAAAGFGPVERDALENLREIHGLEVQLTLMSIGLPGDIGGLNVSRGECPLLAEAKTWVSRTPFLPTRYPKATRAGVPKVDEMGLQIGSPEHELRRLLRLDGFPEPLAVEPVSFTELAGHRMGWASFHRARSAGEGRRAGSAGYGFKVEFPEMVRGPVAVGYGAHFGIGLFVPDNEYDEIRSTKAN